MKAIGIIIAAAVTTVLVIAAQFCWLWPVIEFCLYLFKGSAFNWWSVWTCGGIYVALIMCLFVFGFSSFRK